jgi:hypothetical protein
MTQASRIDAALAAARREEGLVRVSDVCPYNDAMKALRQCKDVQALVVKRQRGQTQQCQLLPEDALRRLLAHVPPARILVRALSSAPAVPRAPLNARARPRCGTCASCLNLSWHRGCLAKVPPAPAQTQEEATREPLQAEVQESTQPAEDISDQTTAVVEGRFCGSTVTFIAVRRSSDGFLDASSMCAAFQKHFRDYLRAEPTQAFLQALAVDICKCESENPKGAHALLGIPKKGRALLGNRTTNPEDATATKASLIQVQHGGAHRGTWIHPLVCVNLGQWLSPEFAVWVTRWIFGAVASSSAPPAQPSLASAEPQPPLDFLLLTLETPEGVAKATKEFDLYVMAVTCQGALSGARRVFKIGRGQPFRRAAERDAAMRRRGLEWTHKVCIIVKDAGDAEHPVRKQFDKVPDTGSDEYVYGDEDFLERFPDVLGRVVPEVIALQQQALRAAQRTLDAEDDDFERTAKRRRIDLELRVEQAKADAETSVTKARAEAEIARLRAEADAATSLAQQKVASELRILKSREEAELLVICSETEARLAELRASRALRH